MGAEKIFDLKSNVKNTKVEKHELKFYSIKDVSDITTFSIPAIRKFISSGRLKCLKMNRKILIPKNELISFIETVSNSKL